MSWPAILLTVSVIALVAANISLLISNNKLMKVNASLIKSVEEAVTAAEHWAANADKWRTKARVLQGKYEPIGRVIATGHADMIAPGETIEIKLEPTVELGPGESVTVDLHSVEPHKVERWWTEDST